MDWIAPDGLMRLDPDDRHPGRVEGAPDSVWNHNGIFFRTIYELLRFERGALSDGKSYVETVNRLEHPSIPGAFLRHQGNVETDEAQDNYAAIFAGCSLFNISSIPRRIYQRLRESGGNIDHKGLGWSAKMQLQGGYMAACAIAARFTPTPWEWFWFLAGVLVNAFSSKEPKKNRGNPVSDAQLAWVNVKNAEHALRHFKFPWWVALGFYPVQALWYWRTAKKYGHAYQPIVLYYPEVEHPNKVLALEIINGH